MSNFGRDGKLRPNGRGIDPKSGNPLLVMADEMQRGEKLIWAERPVSLRAHMKQKLGMALFGVPFLAFALFWTAGAASMGAGAPMDWIAMVFPLFGIPFIAVGLGLVLSPLWAGYRARRLIYAISDRRAIIGDFSRTAKIRSWPHTDLDNLQRDENSDGSGNVLFASSLVRQKNGVAVVREGFVGIGDARRIEHELMNLRKAALRAEADDA
jgi:hypothetical protein